MSVSGRIFGEFVQFGLKQAYASIFGSYLLIIMLVSSYWYPIESLHRYDFIFLSAIIFQLILLVFRLETYREALVIVLFHIVATEMELFKTSDSIGSWSYPEEYFFGIGNVPLFTGFMYSAVGSYIARIWRIFDFEFTDYPPIHRSLVLAFCIYVNFFSHHFVYDFRWVLFALTTFLYWKTIIHFRINKTHRYMPLMLGLFLVALFIWLAENVATYANIWIYPNQTSGWEMVSVAKLSSWFLLMLISFVLITTVNGIIERKPKRVVKNQSKVKEISVD